MTKNEIIRELVKSNLATIGRLFIVYHNRETNVTYTFDYEDTLSHGATYEERRELARVVLSLYRLRRFVQCLRVVYWVRNSDGDWSERYYDFCTRHVHSISDFINTIKK